MNGTAHLADDRLIDLAAQLLPPALASETIRHLETCAPCEERFRSICRDAALARLHPPAQRRALNRRYVAIAASVLLAAALITVWTRRIDRTDVAAYWFPVDSEMVGLRAAAPSADEAIVREAVEAYRRHDARLVVALLRDRSIPEALDPVKIMLASALVKTGESRKAEELLGELRIETIPQPDRDRASWILVAALEGAGRHGEARAVLEKLAARPGEFSDAARRALDRLGQSDK